MSLAHPLTRVRVEPEQFLLRLSDFELGAMQTLDLGTLKTAEPGRLGLDASFPGDPAQYQHRVFCWRRTARGTSRAVLLSVGPGLPHEEIEVLPGLVGVHILGATGPLVRRAILVPPGRALTVPLRPDAPALATFEIQPPVACTAQSVDLRLYRFDEDPGLPGPGTPMVVGVEALVPHANAVVASWTTQRSADGFFSTREIGEGLWALEVAAAGWVGYIAFEVSSLEDAFGFGLELQRDR